MKPDTTLNCVLDFLKAPPEAAGLFDIYRTQLLVWNRRMNLISRHDELKLIPRHFIDSLALLALTEIPQDAVLLDMGTGAGFPGIPLKIVRRDLKLVLLDSKRKKGLFLKALIEALGLDHVRTVIGRAEESVQQSDPADLICSRAVADFSTLVYWGAPYLKPGGGRILALKGPDAERELDAVPQTAAGFFIQDKRFHSAVPFRNCGGQEKRYLMEVALKPYNK